MLRASSIFWCFVIANSVILMMSAAMMSSPEEDASQGQHRGSRQLPLVFPLNGVYKFLIGYSVPVSNTQNLSLNFGSNFQYQYSQFTNITQLTQYYQYHTVSSKRDAVDDWSHRRDERITFYKSLEELMEGRGYNGRDCVMRCICEAAQLPLDEEGLVGELLHLLLKPESWRQEDPYGDAYRAGEQFYDCDALYPGCEADTMLDYMRYL